MSNLDYGFTVIQGKQTGSITAPWLREHRSTVLSILLAAALFVAATWIPIPSREPIMPELPASVVNAEAPGAGGEAFHYYPGQYVNQATEASEHVQAF